MNIIVVGLGSMGKKRIRLIQQIDSNAKIIGIDSQENRRKEAKEMFGIAVANDIKEARQQFDEAISCAIVSTSPLSHAAIITECLINELNVFSEINLVTDGYKENIELAKNKGLILFLSSTFLYRDEIKYIQEKVKKSTCLINYCYHIGQYLPDWHPWEDYKSFFVGDKRTNGCREIMAIEFPWLIKTFGDIDKVTAIGGKMSKLEIGYPDNFQLIIEHKNGTRGILSIDIVCRKAVRNLEIYGEELYLTWNGLPCGLEEYDLVKKESKKINLYKTVDQEEGYSSFIVENAYKNELSAFFEQVTKRTKPVYDFNDDMETLKIIDTVERQVSNEI